MIDTDGDGICDQDETTGCQDSAACNYVATATDAGYCDYADSGYDCDGTCLMDTDEDGICNEFEFLGCTTPSAGNFLSPVTESDGSGILAEGDMIVMGTVWLTLIMMENAI